MTQDLPGTHRKKLFKLVKIAELHDFVGLTFNHSKSIFIKEIPGFYQVKN